MPPTRRIQGDIAFPANAGSGVAAKITVELRDVSMQDQASTVIAYKTLENVRIGPNDRVPFELHAPVVAGNRSLALRVQVDMQANQSHATGDFLSTIAHSVAPVGDLSALVVPVTKL